MVEGQTVQSAHPTTDVVSAAAARATRWEESLWNEGEDRSSPHDLILAPGSDSIEFTQRLLDLLFGGDDAFTVADGLREVSRDVPESLSPRNRFAVRAGGAASLSLPWAVMPLAKRWLRDRVAHLVLITRLPDHVRQLDRRSRAAVYAGLLSAIQHHETGGGTVSLQPTGDPVHGPRAAEREVDRLIALAAFPEVRRLVIDPARLSPGGSEWSASDDLATASERLSRVLEACLTHSIAVSLEPTSYRWAKLAPEVLMRAAADARFDALVLGIRLAAELPESRGAAERVSRWAQTRRQDGGAPVDVVIGSAGLARAERVTSIQTGLAVPTLEEREQVDAQLVRLARVLFDAEGVRTVVASEAPRLIAAVRELAERSDALDRFAVRLRAGVAPGFAQVLRMEKVDVQVLLAATVPDELGGIVESLVALAAEAAELSSRDLRAPFTDIEELLMRTAEPFPQTRRTQMRSREWLPSERDSALFYRPPDEPAGSETAGLTAAVLGLSRSETGEITFEDRATPRPIPAVSASGFANEPITDASIAANREWAAALITEAGAAASRQQRVVDEHAIRRKPHASVESHDTVEIERFGAPQETVEVDAEQLRELRQEVARSLAGELPLPDATQVLDDARDAQARWGAQPPKTRALRLRRAALGVAAARDRLTQSISRDTGAPIPQIDEEVSGIVDAARYLGQLADGLAAVRGAEFLPGGLTLVAASPEVTLTEQAEQVIAALGAGCAVLWAAPAVARGSAVVLVEEWEAAGLSAGAVQLLPSQGLIGETPWVLQLVHGIDRAAVLGDRDLARALRRHRPDLRVEGNFLTTGATIVTPAASGDEAVGAVVRSAFTGPISHRTQAVILVGKLGRSGAFRERLVDAAEALRVGDTRSPGGADPLGFDLGPLPAPASNAAHRALTELEQGEEWILEPRQLDDSGRLWSPGIRAGLTPSSRFWADARGLPLLGVLRARSMSEAIRMQNQVGGGAVAALHSLDATEVSPWLDQSKAARLVVNRASTPARIERHPTGGWRDAGMGMPTLAGGPNRLVTLGSWQVRPGTRSSTLHLHGLDPEVQVLIEASQEVLAYEQFDEVRRAALADALAWRTNFGLFDDSIGLGIERNVVRYWPVSTQLRLAEGGSLAQLLRVVAAALVVRARIAVSTGEVLPPAVATFLATQGITISLERDEDWLERLSVSGATDGRDLVLERVRLIGGDRGRVAEWMSGQRHLTLWAEPVTMAGPVELLSLLREQSITAKATRHGIATTVPELDERLG